MIEKSIDISLWCTWILLQLFRCRCDSIRPQFQRALHTQTVSQTRRATYQRARRLHTRTAVRLATRAAGRTSSLAAKFALALLAMPVSEKRHLRSLSSFGTNTPQLSSANTSSGFESFIEYNVSWKALLREKKNCKNAHFCW